MNVKMKRTCFSKEREKGKACNNSIFSSSSSSFHFFFSLSRNVLRSVRSFQLMYFSYNCTNLLYFVVQICQYPWYKYANTRGTNIAFSLGTKHTFLCGTKMPFCGGTDCAQIDVQNTCNGVYKRSGMCIT